MDKNKISNSFTIIELLIVVAIIALFSGLSLAYYNNFGQQAKLKEEARKIVDVLELAKKKANSGDIPPGVTCSSGFNGYQVKGTDKKTYLLSLCCGGQCNLPINTYSIPANSNVVINSMKYFIDITHSYDISYVKFKLLTAGVNIPNPSDPLDPSKEILISLDTSPNTQVVIVLKSATSLKCIPITITPSAIIKEGAERAC